MTGPSLMDKFIEMVCMDLDQLPNGMVIPIHVMDEAIKNAAGKIVRGEIAGFIGDSVELEVEAIYRSGSRVYCRARLLAEDFPPGGYGLTCGGTVNRIRDTTAEFSFCSVGVVYHPVEPLTK